MGEDLFTEAHMTEAETRALVESILREHGLLDTSPPPPLQASGAYKPPDCPYQELVDAYHEHCPTMTRLRVMTNMRMKHARARWVEVTTSEKMDKAQALDWFRWYFSRAGASKFLSGRVQGNRRPWKADFQWLLQAGNFAKVLEGKYSEEAA